MNAKKKAKWDAADRAAKEAVKALDKIALADEAVGDTEEEGNKQVRRFLVSLIDRLSCAGYDRHYITEQGFECLKTYRNIW